MESHRGLETGPAARQLQRRGAAEAEADGGQAGRIGLGLGAQHGQGGAGPGANGQRIGHEGAELGHDFFHGQGGATPVIVHGEGDIAGLGQPLGDVEGMVRQAQALRRHQYARSAAAHGLVDEQPADQSRAVGVIFDILDMHDGFPAAWGRLVGAGLR